MVGAQFTRTWTATLVGTEYYDITVQVTWQDEGQNKNVTVRGRRFNKQP